MTGPPIIRRPCALTAPSATARDMAEKQGEQPKIPGTPCSISLYEQALEMFEPKACVARAVVVFDPRHILVPETAVRLVDFPPWSGGVRSERHAAVRMVIRSMLARASAGVR